ncbi:MAG TPA: hypothetical protein VF791_06675 [Pyrinomonadaceae bacterium]
MRCQRLKRAFVSPGYKYPLLICAVAILCLNEGALAQSGRRLSRSAQPAPTPAVTGPQTEAVAAQPEEKFAPISGVIVAGDLVQSGSSFSNHVDLAVDACVDRLKEGPVINAKGSGSMKRLKAMDRAKEETDVYVLWLEIQITESIDNDYRLNEKICVINYYVFEPKTAKILAEGRVDPKSQSIRAGGGAVLRLPRGSSRTPITIQLKDGGREVADRVRRKLQQMVTPQGNVTP